MISNRLTISPELSIGSFRDPPIQLKLARDDRLGEIPFAVEIRHYMNFANPLRIESKKRTAQTPPPFPNTASHTRKDFPAPNLPRMLQRRRARVRIHRRAVRDDQ